MADELGRTSHEKSIVLLSADGLSEGASGIREFIESYPTLGQVDAVVAITRPGTKDPVSPHLLTWSAGPESTSAQLVESGKLALEEETDYAAGQGGFLGGLFRLAIPAGLGPEAVAISEGIDSVAISGSPASAGWTPAMTTSPRSTTSRWPSSGTPRSRSCSRSTPTATH